MTTSAPARMAPWKAMTVWGRLGSWIATREPSLTPRFRSAVAQRLTLSSSCEYVNEQLRNEIAGRSPHFSAARATKRCKGTSSKSIEVGTPSS